MVASIAISEAEPQSTDASDDRLERLERAFEQLEQRNAELEEKVRRLEAKERSSTTQNVAASTKQRTEISGGGRQTPKSETVGVVTETKTSDFELRLGGFIQTQVEIGDVSAFEGRFPIRGLGVFGATEVKDRFRVRRSRLNVSGDYADQLEFKLEGEFQLNFATNSSRTSFAGTDLFVNWHAYPEVNIKVGQFKAPFGLEQLTADSRLLSIESSLATTALAPDRQVGVQVWGRPLASFGPERADLLTYYAGVFNGTGRNISVNDNSEFMYVGRLEVVALRSRILNEDATVMIGVSGLTSRDDPGTIFSNALFLNADGSLSAFASPTAGGREAYGFDAAIRLGRFDLRAEYLSQRVFEREVAGFVPRGAGFRADGYYAQGSYFLLPEKLQFVAKWESFDPGQAPNDGIHSITAGVNYYFHGDRIKLLANYIHTWSDFRESNPLFGESEFDEVILRLQVMF